jgi:hypothetical protein
VQTDPDLHNGRPVRPSDFLGSRDFSVEMETGTGKTHVRLNAPELRALPYLEIADIYREFEEFDWYEPFWALAKRVREALGAHRGAGGRARTNETGGLGAPCFP